MSDEVSFNLFGEGGFINPTPWSHTQSQGPIGSKDWARGRWTIPFYDARTGVFLQKQTSEFDGGWRWFDAYEVEALTIYNQKLDKRAYFHLTQIDIVDTRLSPECLLFWAKSMVLVEHRYYVTKNWLEDHIRAMARRAMIEIRKEIYGEPNDRSHLRSI